ncbi:MAG: methyltransferase domain-containing protein [Lentisphaeria bacterium]|nr:methyltransferase domain-containing protein [Lentisphaeria bacterium]NQZ67414.1 methyltransferase domain-containing protein [Lentisphaeria bacterium]
MKRIFQIGFNRCGTTSLHRFFEINNIKSIHWDDGKLARKIYENYSQSHSLIKGYEEYQSFTDMVYKDEHSVKEVHVDLFRALYNEFPDAIYIFNDRNPTDWIESRMKKGRSAENAKCQLGLKTDAELKAYWLKRYIDHKNDVLSFFAKKENFVHYDLDEPESFGMLIDTLNKNNFKLNVLTLPYANKTYNAKRNAASSKSEKDRLMGVPYSYDFNKDRYQKSVYSAKTVLSIVLDALPPVHSAIDFGCGVGTWLSVLQEKGVEKIQGLDGPWLEQDLLKIAKQDFREVDFEDTISSDKKYDLAMSLEVAEHLSPETATRFVDSLVLASDFVLFSAAIPFQIGQNHINEQWQDYWADLFTERGYVTFDFVRGKIWTDKQIPVWYRQNILLFVKEGQIDKVKVTSLNEEDSNFPISIVHPDKYLSKVRRLDSLKKEINKMNSVKGSWR